VRAGLALVVAAAVAVGLLLEVRPGHTHETMRARATMTPSAPRFGDLVTARVDVPRGARVAASFRPFEVVGASHTPTAWTFTLRCVAVACLTRGRNVPVQLPPARVSVGGRTELVPWPVVSVGSRLSAADLARPVFLADTTPPAPRYRVDPVVLGWTLAGIAAALVLAVGGWAASVLRRRRSNLQLVADDRDLSPLERAFEELERALGESVGRRRIALDRLARELELLDDVAPLALRARRLGWSLARPDQAEIRRLLDDCRQVRAA
jgi:hypothetical protein